MPNKLSMSFNMLEAFNINASKSIMIKARLKNIKALYTYIY
jgi:hypothetical protein